MVKNSHIHLNIETELHEKLKKEAQSRGVTLSALCVSRLNKDPEIVEVRQFLFGLMKEILEIKSKVFSS
jgi:hypothetical protein